MKNLFNYLTFIYGNLSTLAIITFNSLIISIDGRRKVNESPTSDASNFKEN